MKRSFAVTAIVALVAACGAGTSAPASSAAASTPAGLRAPDEPFPSTADRIHVFNDQMTYPLSDGLLGFATSHYDGTQKMPVSAVDALKAEDPGFVVLQYRLALGLGYRATSGGCTPNGGWLLIIKGDRWVKEWPKTVREQWFTHRGGSRVLQCEWGWYLTNPDNTSWQDWFTARLAGQIAATHTDAAFLDSASIPNYLGGLSFSPALPDYDPQFEVRWAAKIARWLPLVQTRIGVPVIANVGAWVTSRDPTDYSGIDGVMVEQFAAWGSDSPFAPEDWALEMDRVLSLVRQDRVVITQTYPDVNDVGLRMFTLGSYLLAKGDHTYLNLDVSMQPEWFPEYGIDLGPAVDPVPQHVADLADGDVFLRRYQNGLVVVNPGDSSATYSPGGTWYRATPQGGGIVPDSGVLPGSWRVTTSPVTSVTLGPQSAAVLLALPL